MAGMTDVHGVDVRTAAKVARLGERLDAYLKSIVLDVDRVLAEVPALEREAELLGADYLRYRARLVRADALDRNGDVGTGARLAWEVNRWAAEHDDRYLLAQSHRLLSFAYQNLGDSGSCLDHALRCVELVDETFAPWDRARQLTALAGALSWVGSYDEARRRFAAAEEIFIALGDVERQLVVLNNLAYTEHQAGEPHRAFAVAGQMVVLAQTHGLWLNPSYVDTIARTHMRVGHHAEAGRLLRECLSDWRPNLADADALAEILLTLGEAERLGGRPVQAAQTLDRCGELCDERGLAHVRVRLLEERAILHAANGDFERAYETHRAFHAESESLRSVEREARAQIRHAMFETAEARQDAERFWDQARRDPLTGLRNRLFVDERLPVLIAHAARGGTALAVALVDLDHFKRINDSLSHEVGDRVLVQVATLLSAGADKLDGGFAARLGGEEFLLVLPGVTVAAATALLDLVRETVRSHDWQPLTGNLPVTVSAGVAGTQPDSTRSTLLEQADLALYKAKRGGRNRVVTA